jgi:hypothetical protein
VASERSSCFVERFDVQFVAAPAAARLTFGAVETGKNIKLLEQGIDFRFNQSPSMLAGQVQQRGSVASFKLMMPLRTYYQIRNVLMVKVSFNRSFVGMAASCLVP